MQRGCHPPSQTRQAPRHDEWSIPGGAVELGETMRDAARREVREECQIDAAIGDVLAAIDIIVHDPDGRVRYDYAIVDYYGDLRGRRIARVERRRAAMVGDTIGPATPFNERRTRRIVERAFAMRDTVV